MAILQIMQDSILVRKKPICKVRKSNSNRRNKLNVPPQLPYSIHIWAGISRELPNGTVMDEGSTVYLALYLSIKQLLILWYRQREQILTSNYVCNVHGDFIDQNKLNRRYLKIYFRFPNPIMAWAVKKKSCCNYTVIQYSDKNVFY